MFWEGCTKSSKKCAFLTPAPKLDYLELFLLQWCNLSVLLFFCIHGSLAFHNKSLLCHFKGNLSQSIFEKRRLVSLYAVKWPLFLQRLLIVWPSGAWVWVRHPWCLMNKPCRMRLTLQPGGLWGLSVLFRACTRYPPSISDKPGVFDGEKLSPFSLYQSQTESCFFLHSNW